jgi:hypothetical protein
MPESAPRRGNEVTVTLNWVEILFKVLAASVLPLLLWGVRLESKQTTQELKIQQITEEVAATRGHATALVRLEEQVKSANEKLVEIKVLLNKRPVE